MFCFFFPNWWNSELCYISINDFSLWIVVLLKLTPKNSNLISGVNLDWWCSWWMDEQWHLLLVLVQVKNSFWQGGDWGKCWNQWLKEEFWLRRFTLASSLIIRDIHSSQWKVADTFQIVNKIWLLPKMCSADQLPLDHLRCLLISTHHQVLFNTYKSQSLGFNNLSESPFSVLTFLK